MKIGPLTKRNSRRPCSSSSRTLVPVMSRRHQVGRELDALEGHVEDLASELTMSVLARPGTPTSRQWPRVKMAARICSMTSVWPTMTRRSCSSIWAAGLAELGQIFADVSVDTVRFLSR